MVAEVFKGLARCCGGVKNTKVCWINGLLDYYAYSINRESSRPHDLIVLLVLSTLLLEFFLFVFAEVAVSFGRRFYVLYLWVTGILELFRSCWIDKFPNA